jgi:hypothetical protein
VQPGREGERRGVLERRGEERRGEERRGEKMGGSIKTRLTVGFRPTMSLSTSVLAAAIASSSDFMVPSRPSTDVFNWEGKGM